jgi:fumarylacetoacetate (FAA) hydrolase family protein
MLGMAATGLPKGWGNALLVGRLDASDGPLPVIVENGRVRDVDVSASVAPDTGIAALMRTRARRGLLPEPQ